MVMIDIKNNCPRCNYPFLMGTLEPNKLRCPSCKRSFTLNPEEK